MKHVLEYGGSSRLKSGAGTLCLMLALAIGGGCGKPKDTSTSAESPAADTATSTSTDPANRMHPAPPSVSANTGQNGPTQIQLLNRAVLGWKMKYHRQPRNFEELASTPGFQIPAPPAGKKYALDKNGFIILINAN